VAFEQIHLRLNTVTELGDVVVTLSPAMSVIKGIQGGLSSMMPQADQSFGQISDLLGSIMSQSGQMPAAVSEIGGGIADTGLNEEAMKILEEASGIIEENTKNKFPDLPVDDEVESSSSTSKERHRSSTTSLF
jgi:division protein CdvB (Snf7/Vps24/ESCRT-III family)